MNINNLDKNKLLKILIDLFLFANKSMLEQNSECVENNISERSICADLKSSFDSILPSSIFNKYYADVEYNRGNGKTLKSYEMDGHIFKMTCDFILHSRGKLQLDNLICLEMKKKSSKEPFKNKDRDRLKSLTMPGGCENIGRNLIVRDYYLGIFYIIDFEHSQIELEFYSDGALFQTEIMTFNEVLHYKSSLSFISKRTITFFNMNFGDSFLIKDFGDSLLVDCGTINQRKSRRNYMLDLISNEMRYLKNNLLITHYHFDHTSSILKLNDKGISFDNVYIRCLDINCFKFDFYSSFIELFIYAIRSRDYNSLLQWLNPKGLIRLLHKSGNVYGVNCTKNNMIRFGYTAANVLWPSPEDVELSEMKALADKIESILFDNTVEDVSEEEISFVKNRIRAVYRCYESIYERLVENENGVSREELSIIVSDVGDDITKADIVSFSRLIKLLPSRLRKKLSDLENHLSVIIEIDSQLLMCGDADNSALDGALLNYAENHGSRGTRTEEFDIIKVPHHGTSNYYYDFKNDRALYLIPNSKLYRHGWEIDKKYVDGHKRCISLNNGYNSSCPNSKMCGCKCPYVGILDLFRTNF